jgi:hypothetical protein
MARAKNLGFSHRGSNREALLGYWVLSRMW